MFFPPLQQTWITITHLSSFAFFVRHSFMRECGPIHLDVNTKQWLKWQEVDFSLHLCGYFTKKIIKGLLLLKFYIITTSCQVHPYFGKEVNGASCYHVAKIDNDSSSSPFFLLKCGLLLQKYHENPGNPSKAMESLSFNHEVGYKIMYRIYFELLKHNNL